VIEVSLNLNQPINHNHWTVLWCCFWTDGTLFKTHTAAKFTSISTWSAYLHDILQQEPAGYVTVQVQLNYFFFDSGQLYGRLLFTHVFNVTDCKCLFYWHCIHLFVYITFIRGFIFTWTLQI